MKMIGKTATPIAIVLVLVAGGLGGLAYAEEPDQDSLNTHLLAVMPDSGYYDPADLGGAKIGLPPSEDTVWDDWAETALATYGISYDSFSLAWNETYAALSSGVVDAVLVYDHPWEYLPSGDEVRFLPWSSEAIDAVVEQFDAIPAYLPADTYPWQTEAVLGYAPTPVNEVDVHLWRGYVYVEWGNSFADHEVRGGGTWGTGVTNTDDASNSAVCNLTIALDSELVFEGVHPQPTTMGPPTYEWLFGDIPEAVSEFDQANPHVSKADATPFYPGLDASRTWDNPQFSAPRTQTLTITVTPRRAWESIVVCTQGLDNELVSTVIASVVYDDTDPDQHIALALDGQNLHMYIQSPVVGKLYSYEVTIEVTPKVGRLEFMPYVYIQGSDEIDWGEPEGDSFSRTIPGVGEWTYSAEGNYLWHWNDRDRRALSFQRYCYIPMDDFAIKHMVIDFDRRPNLDEIATKATFRLHPDASYDLGADDVIVSIDGVDVTIPAGSFKKRLCGERYYYNSPRGEKPKIVMGLNFDEGKWSLLAHDIDASAVDNRDGVDMAFSIGSMSATDHVKMRVERLSYIGE